MQSKKDRPLFVAHSPNAQGLWHSFWDHSREVARLASQFAKELGLEKEANLLGWWHDAGKLHPDWQQGLEKIVECDEKNKLPPHADVGFLALLTHKEQLLLALLIACHHRGLQDFRTKTNEWCLQARENAYLAEAVQVAKEHIEPFCPLGQPISEKLLARLQKGSFRYSLLLRMLHSCLIDADFLDTEAHFYPANQPLRESHYDLSALWASLEGYQNTMREQPLSKINSIRAQMYQDALRASCQAPGFFSLTMPTGGGKTRTSMAFALKHAIRWGKKRVIVAIPYTSIIEQNADVYRSIFGEEHVLEHHSAIDFSKDEMDDHKERRRHLLSQNWDSPVIVTTNVQFFESLFASKNSKLRKIHNIQNSVIVLDEVQTLPPALLEPTLIMLRSLVEDFGCSIVFCTATQPIFSDELIYWKDSSAVLKNIREIVQDPLLHFQALQRVDFYLPPEKPFTHEEMATQIAEHPRCLAIFNTVKDAKIVLTALESHFSRKDLFHLSTHLCGAHRRQVLKEVKRRLEKKQDCILISTQVIEAGVDIDFPVVFRSVAPLDSMLQAAGRCNREAKQDKGNVFFFELQNESFPPGVYKQGKEVSKTICSQITSQDFHDPALSHRYFRSFYSGVSKDKEGILAFEQELQLKTSSEKYRFIAEPTLSVLVWFDQKETEINEAIEQLRRNPYQRKSLKPLQSFLVQMYEKNFKKALYDGLIQPLQGLEELHEWIGEYSELFGISQELSHESLVIC